MENPLVQRMRPFGTTIFTTMSELAARTGAVNLGQGFPDTNPPAWIQEHVTDAMARGINQYPQLFGAPALREAIAEHQRRFYGLDVDPDREVLVTFGATDALASALSALVEPGDEVVVIEPAFDVYTAGITLAGGVQVGVPLRLPDLTLDEAALAAAITPRTRAILLNTPHNPTGKIFTREELAAIGALAVRHGIWILSDEVYEHLAFDAPHTPMASLAREIPGLDQWVLTISSAGKAFSVTGWKIGWIVGPAPAVRAAAQIKQFTSFTGGAPFQPAIAAALSQSDEAYAALNDGMRHRRDVLAEGLSAAGFGLVGGHATYFQVADAAPLGVTDAAQFCLEMPEKYGVVAIPVSAFCSDPDYARTLIRFAYCKQPSVLAEASARLAPLARLAPSAQARPAAAPAG